MVEYRTIDVIFDYTLFNKSKNPLPDKMRNTDFAFDSVFLFQPEHKPRHCPAIPRNQWV